MNTELPTSAEIFARLPKLKDADTKVVDELRKWVFESTSLIKTSVAAYVEHTDYKEDPEVYINRLYRYHLLLGAMSGLVEGLYERAIFLPYKDLTETARSSAVVTKQKLTAGDREIYAKGEASDLKALKKDIEETLSNMEMRLWGARQNNKKW